MTAAHANGTNGSNGASVLGDAIRVHDAAMRSTHRLPREKFAEWIADKSSPEYGAQQCVIFLLQHDHEQNGLRPLSPMRLPKRLKGAQREQAIQRIVDEIDDLSLEYAKRFSRIQGFMVGGSAKEGGQAECQFAFNVSPPAETADLFHQRDKEANLSAVIGHLQRLADRGMTVGEERASKENERMVELFMHSQQRVDQLTERVLSQAKALETALSEQNLRDIEVKRSELELRMIEELGGKLVAFAGAAAGEWLQGKAAARAKATAQDGIDPRSVVAFSRSLSPEQAQAFGPIVTLFLGALPDAKRVQIRQICDELDAEKAGASAPDPEERKT